MKDIITPKTLNLSVYLGAILIFWALTLNECIIFESKSINFTICSKNNTERFFVKQEENNSKCQLVEKIDIQIEKDEDIVNFLPAKIRKNNLTKLM